MTLKIASIRGINSQGMLRKAFMSLTRVPRVSIGSVGRALSSGGGAEALSVSKPLRRVQDVLATRAASGAVFSINHRSTIKQVRNAVLQYAYVYILFKVVCMYGYIVILLLIYCIPFS